MDWLQFKPSIKVESHVLLSTPSTSSYADLSHSGFEICGHLETHYFQAFHSFAAIIPHVEFHIPCRQGMRQVATDVTTVA